jgi:UDP-N-acetylglucosamine:LPS N-acetylglucosamine transferase
LPKRPRIDFVFFDAGGGHRSAALALQSVIASQNREWDVQLVNLQQTLDALDVFRKLLGVRLEDIYNLALAKGWTLGSGYLLPCMHAIIRIYHASQVRLLISLWRERVPDLVVSLVPNFNRALFQSLQAARPGIPLVTIMTDLADYPPHFWIEDQPQYFICGTDEAVRQAIKIGHCKERVFRVSGMILRPDFYRIAEIDRSYERSRLGLANDLPTVLLLFGGQGSPVMLEIAKRLGNSNQDLQLIAICGRNEKLRARLNRLTTRNKIFVEGFTKDIPYYMRLSDLFIGKPGPGSISEAVHMGLPVIVERNAWTLPQERYNATWIEERGVGIVLKTFRRIEASVDDLLKAGNLVVMRERARKLQNFAVYEIPDILASVLASEAPGLRLNTTVPPAGAN